MATERLVHRLGTPTQTEAGFAQVRHVEMDNPFNSLYELTR